jgi:type II secretion system protein H
VSALLDNRRDSGFTLAELLVAITVAGILLALAAPSMATMYRIYGLRGAARQVYAELQNARMAAVTENRGYQFTVADSRSYKVLDDQNNDQAFADPSEVVISRQLESQGVTLSGNSVTFTARGMASAAGTVTVTDAAGTAINVTVSPAGSIRIN